MSTTQALANATDALARELTEGMRSEENRHEAAREQVRRTTAISPDTSTRSMRHASAKALDELEGRQAAYLEELSTRHTAEQARLKQQGTELDRRIDDMQHSLAALIEQRGETDREIREDRKRYEEKRRECEHKFKVLIDSQRRVISAIDGLGGSGA